MLTDKKGELVKWLKKHKKDKEYKWCLENKNAELRTKIIVTMRKQKKEEEKELKKENHFKTSGKFDGLIQEEQKQEEWKLEKKVSENLESLKAELEVINQEDLVKLSELNY